LNQAEIPPDDTKGGGVDPGGFRYKIDAHEGPVEPQFVQEDPEMGLIHGEVRLPHIPGERRVKKMAVDA